MSATSFEQALEQYGDDLYRLAVLLSPDQAAANALLVRTARQFRNRTPAVGRRGGDERRDSSPLLIGQSRFRSIAIEPR